MAKRIIQKSLSAAFLGLCSIEEGEAATLVWSENFGSLASGTSITTSNTAFGGVSPSNGTIDAITSTVGTGTSLRLVAATASNPASGTWVGGGGFGTLTTMTMEFSVSIQSLGSGRLAFYMGSGNTVSNFGNTNVNPDHFVWDVAVNGVTGRLEYRDSTGNYQNLGPDTLVLGTGVDYNFLIQVNATAIAVDGVAANSMNLYLDGVLAASGVGLRGSGNSTAFRIGARGASAAGALAAEFDDLRIWNGIQPVPEPGSLMLAGAGGLLALRRRRPTT